MALATLRDTVVRGELPPWNLTLSHSLTEDLPMPETTLLPLYTSPCHDNMDKTAYAQTIFRWFRRAGPLYSLTMDVDIGYDDRVCVIEYWKEEHLRFARRMGGNLRPNAEQTLFEEPVGVIDPWNLYCAVSASTVRPLSDPLRQEYRALISRLRSRIS